jgi:hypothetical protein
VSTPAAASVAAPRATSGNRTLLQAPPLLIVLQRGGQLVELAHQDPVEVVDEQVDAVVLDALFLEVVGADLLGALAASDLGLARGCDRGLLLGERALLQARAQHAHRALAVLKL